MADFKISDLPPLGDALKDTDLIEVSVDVGGGLYESNSISITNFKGGIVGVYAILEDQKASGTFGGNATKGGFQTRDLNVITSDVGGIVTQLIGNEFKVIDGEYIIFADAPAGGVDGHQITMYDGSSNIIIGSSQDSRDDDYVDNRSFLTGRFQGSSLKSYSIQHYTGTGVVGNLGFASNSGLTEVYTRVTLIRIGD
jgi:hypothetical protein